MPILLKGGLLIDGTGAAPIADGAVLIDGERVLDVGPARAITPPPGTAVIDVTGKTIMPGLIDAHDHMCHTGFDRAARLASPLSLTMMKVADNLRVTLEAGITTVRDAGGLDLGFKLAVEQGLIPGPRLVLGVSIISRTGGIGDPRLPNGADLSGDLPGLPWPVADGVDECRRKVREVVHAGADQVKLASTGGVNSQTLTAIDVAYTYEEVAAIADEARLQGKRSFVHAYGGLGLDYAIRAGIDSIEHGAYLCRTPEWLDQMAERGTYLCPTFMVIELHRTKGSPFARFKAAEMQEDHARTLQMALERGVPIAMGTDAGGYGHGHNAVELQLLVAAGMTSMQAIVASTKTAAECSGLGQDVGTLTPGKYADLLVVDGNPLDDVSILDQQTRLAMVMKGGKAYVDRLSRPA
ncbi:MAG TPA: amidohydrolase family protein [Nitrolancea sp.]|nr:amidohydrolase family protein [Nitrolancea sp.]